MIQIRVLYRIESPNRSQIEIRTMNLFVYILNVIEMLSNAVVCCCQSVLDLKCHSVFKLCKFELDR